MWHSLLLSLWDGEVFLRLLLASLFGLIIGYERFTHGRPAGIRTHLLVCLASAAVMALPERYFELIGGQVSGRMALDPSRLAAGAITGIGFLGAGVIVKTRASVHGLTTAACIWLVSVIGLLLGAGLYGLALACLVIAVVSLAAIRKIEEVLGRLTYSVLEITTPISADAGEKVGNILASHGVKFKMTDFRTDLRADRSTVSYLLQSYRYLEGRKMVLECQQIPDVIRVVLKSQVME